MGKKMVLLAVIMTMLVSIGLTGCGKKEETKAAVKAKTIRISTTLTEGNPSVEALKLFAKTATEKSGGTMDVKVFANSQLGGNRDGLEGLMSGTLEMVMVTSGPAAQFVPIVDVLGLPYIFQSADHMHAVLDGEPGKILGKKLNEKGFEHMFWLDGGSRSVINNKRPVNSPEDLKGLKIRVQPAKSTIELMNAMGAIATPMEQSEVYSALEQGVIDGWENSPVTLLSLKLYEVSKYFSYTNHLMLPDMLLMSKKVYDGLSDKDKQVLREAAKEAQTKQRGLWADYEGKAIKELETKGVKFNQIKDTTPFVNAVRPVWKTFTTANGADGEDLIKKIEALKK